MKESPLLEELKSGFSKSVSGEASQRGNGTAGLTHPQLPFDFQILLLGVCTGDEGWISK